MAKQTKNPEESDFLAVVSEWSSTARQGWGVVGNAYPILNVSTGEVVASPEEDFPNPGCVFLFNRAHLKTWDFVLLRPKRNEHYRNNFDRDCYFIPTRVPDLVEFPNQAEKVAVILSHPSFDPLANVRHLTNPLHNVTPYFFVKRNSRLYGPLVSVSNQLSPTEDLQRIDWRPARADGVYYEFGEADLAGQGLHVSEYRHPQPHLNRVIASPIGIVTGNIVAAKSGRALEALSDEMVIEWFLRRCPPQDVPSGTAEVLKASFRSEGNDDPAVVAARINRILRSFENHAAFGGYRDLVARRYLDSEAGKRRVQEIVDQTVARKAGEIQGEVDRRQADFAARRDELERLKKDAERDYEAFVDSQRRKGEELRHQHAELERNIGELKQTLTEDAGTLADRMREQLPLIAALTDRRNDGESHAPITQESSRSTRDSGFHFSPISPTATPAPMKSEAALVKDLHAGMAGAGLYYSREFIANAYACMKSEALNLVIGPPGYGKSMLVTALARLLGHGDAFLQIAVRRSWAEDRNLLGAYDSFHGRYDPGPTGLVVRMLQAEADWKADRTGIYIVLLDEFNLAAPEYYFSQLLQSLPSDDRSREVRLYDPSLAGEGSFPPRVALGPNLRFWGTINYDETTERLSPRALDRTGMIFLGEADVQPSADEGLPSVPGVAAKDIFGQFLKTAEDCPEDRWAAVTEVVDLLRLPETGLGPRVELSPRVRRGMRRYLANSAGVMEARTAVDFVIQQRILPVVRGRGDDFLVRIRRLAQLLGDRGYARSAQHVEEAVRRSEQQFGELDLLGY